MSPRTVASLPALHTADSRLDGGAGARRLYHHHPLVCNSIGFEAAACALSQAATLAACAPCTHSSGTSFAMVSIPTSPLGATSVGA